MIRNYEACLKKFEEICDLDDNWNGNGCARISTVAACNALLLLEQLPDFGDWYVYPVAHNPAIIQIEMENDKIYIEIECHPLDYNIFVVYPDDEKIHMNMVTVKSTVKYLNKIYG